MTKLIIRWITKLKRKYKEDFDKITEEQNEDIFALFEKQADMTDSAYQKSIAEIQKNLKTRTDILLVTLTKKLILNSPD